MINVIQQPHYFSFGSGFNLESNDTEYLEALKADVAYANAKGIEVGGYDLIALTRFGDANRMGKVL